MKFQKGQPKLPGSGRKKGTPNKRRISKVGEVLAEHDMNPASEIIKEIALMDEPKDRANAWIDLLAYCEAKPKTVEENDDDDFNPEDFKDISTEELLRIVKSSKGPA